MRSPSRPVVVCGSCIGPIALGRRHAEALRRWALRKRSDLAAVAGARANVRAVARSRRPPRRERLRIEADAASGCVLGLGEFLRVCAVRSGAVLAVPAPPAGSVL